MKYISIVADTYEDAVKEAKSKYGDQIRVHSRRDYTVPGGLFTRKQKKCEITCYISSNAVKTDSSEDMSEFEKEAKTPNPMGLSSAERLNTEIHRGTGKGFNEAEKLLTLNYIYGPLREHLLDNLSCTAEDCPRVLSEKILSCVNMDYEAQLHPSRVVVFLGPTGGGKTTTLAKVAYMYRQLGKKVGIITLDSYRVGAFEQIKAFADALDMPLQLVDKEGQLVSALESYSYYDLILVDTMGLSSKDLELNLKLKSMANILTRMNTSFSLILSASMKEEDMMKHYSRYKDDYNVNSIIITKLDESRTIGNALSFSYRVNLPILFFTDGQKVPEDLVKASTDVVVQNLIGFGLDKRAFRGQL